MIQGRPWGRWVLVVVIALLAFIGVELMMLVIDSDADELRLALVVSLLVMGAAALLDVGGVESISWHHHPAGEKSLGRVDPPTAAQVRIISAHLSANEPDASLRNRLRVLAGNTLLARHDLGWEDPNAAELLGPELLAVLTAPPRRLSLDTVESCLRRIEDM